MDKSFFDFLSHTAYRLKFADNGRLRWVEGTGDHAVAHDSEPGTSWVQRAAVAVLSHLPVEWLL